MSPHPERRIAERFEPWWAVVLAALAGLLAVGCLVVAGRFVWMFIAGEQYGILGLLGALVTVGIGLFVGLPALGYLRSRQRGQFIAVAVCGGLVVAGILAFAVFVASSRAWE